jgi:uncharacterized protein (TIRG00374 family)
LKNIDQDPSLDHKEKETLGSISGYKIIIPMLLGMGVVAYLLWRQFDWNEFREINWDSLAFFWLGVAVLIYILRHLALSWRLKLLADHHFSWRKSIELIFIWEFASAVSPTSIGGTVVALFLLAQEKLRSSRAITIVIYSIILDTAFFLLAFVLLLIFIGPVVITPGATGFFELGHRGYIFFVVMGVLLLYAGILFWGVFIQPKKIKALICFFGRIKWFEKYRAMLVQTGEGVVEASGEMSSKNWWFHTRVFIATSLAWILRFAVVNAIIIALIHTVKTDAFNQVLLFGRNMNMYIQTAFTPTPGASGFSEIMFSGLYSDIVPVGVALLIAIIWRLISYYAYLFAGMIVVPNWVRKLIIRRRLDQESPKELPERFE